MTAAPEFSAEERAAMKQRAKELKQSQDAAEALQGVLDRIANLAEHDRLLAEKVHEIAMSVEPAFAPRTWYGFPAYYLDGKLVCFFKDAGKFKDRYATLGFEQHAALDDGNLWPTSYAVLEIGPAEEKRLRQIIATAAGR